MNSMRDEVKDAIAKVLVIKPEPKSFSEAYELSAEIADAVFEVLGIDETTQDKPKRGAK